MKQKITKYNEVTTKLILCINHVTLTFNSQKSNYEWSFSYKVIIILNILFEFLLLIIIIIYYYYYYYIYNKFFYLILDRIFYYMERNRVSAQLVINF